MSTCEQLSLFGAPVAPVKPVIDRVRAYMERELAWPNPDVQFYIDETGETVCPKCLRRGAIYIGGLGIGGANAKSVTGLSVKIGRHFKCPGFAVTL